MKTSEFFYLPPQNNGQNLINRYQDALFNVLYPPRYGIIGETKFYQWQRWRLDWLEYLVEMRRRSRHHVYER